MSKITMTGLLAVVLLSVAPPDMLRDWDMAFKGIDKNSAWGIAENNDGDFIIVGRTRSVAFEESDLWSIETNGEGYCYLQGG